MRVEGVNVSHVTRQKSHVWGLSWKTQVLPFTKGWGGVTPGVNIPARDRASINNDRSPLKLSNVPDKIHRREEYAYVAGNVHMWRDVAG